MLLPRRISENRPTVLLGVLVAVSLVFLASGTPASRISGGIRTIVSVVAYPFLKGFKAVENTSSYLSGFVTNYEAGRAESKKLRAELDALAPRLAEQQELRQENLRLRSMIHFARRQPKMSLLPAEVIGRGVGTLIVDRGSVHGVQPFMCAMTKDGVVGVVTDVKPSLSCVATLHNADCNIGAVVRRNRAAGVVQGSGSDFSHICMMQYIDLKDEVRVGDDVVTSGGRVFPRGYPIGTVMRVDDDGTLLKTAYVEPATDPYRADEVFLVQMAQPELDQLVQPDRSKQADTAPYSLPDERSIQQRYAP